MKRVYFNLNKNESIPVSRNGLSGMNSIYYSPMKTYFLLILVLFPVISLFSQEQMKKTHLIFESGLILSSLTEGEGGIGAGLKLNFVQNKHAIGAFYYFTGESWGYENVNYTGVTFGHHEKADYFTLDLSAGTGVVFGTHKGKFISSSWFSDNYEKESFTTMGIHGEFDFVLQLLPGFGIGTKLYAAYNPENPNLGAFILMKIGKP